MEITPTERSTVCLLSAWRRSRGSPRRSWCRRARTCGLFLYWILIALLLFAIVRYELSLPDSVCERFPSLWSCPGNLDIGRGSFGPGMPSDDPQRITRPSPSPRRTRYRYWWTTRARVPSPVVLVRDAG